MSSGIAPSCAAIGLACLPAFGSGAQTSPASMPPAKIGRALRCSIATAMFRSRWTHPGLTPGRTTFTSHDEMLRHIEHVEARAPHRHRGTLGRSRQGRETPYLVFTAEGLSDPARIRALNRPIASVAPAGVEFERTCRS